MMRINFDEMINAREEKKVPTKTEADNSLHNSSSYTEEPLYNEEKTKKVVTGLFDDEPEPIAAIEKETPSRMLDLDIKSIIPKPTAKAIPEPAPKRVEQYSDNAGKLEKTEKTARKKRPKASKYVFEEDNSEYEYEDLRGKYATKNPIKSEKSRTVAAIQNDEANDPIKTPAKKSNNYARMQDELVASDDGGGIASSSIKGLAIVLAAIFLFMLVFLVYRNNILNSQLVAANLQAERVQVLEQELSHARIELERVNENLVYTPNQEETQIPPILPNDTYADESVYNGYSDTVQESAYDDAYDSYQQEPEEQEVVNTSQVPAPGPREHEVRSGDNLSRIARQFYGNDSYANIQRIIQANNITDPDNIPIGRRLIIPE